MEVRKQLIDQLKYKMKQPNSMIPHKAAITCRTAKSFIRIGHFDLFARRVQNGSNAVERKTARRQLDKLIMHTIKREFPSGYGFLESQVSAINDLGLVTKFLEITSGKIARLAADWIRVGFCQGNFNSDNCLVAGRTMDYGPFGYIQKFESYWNMWLGGGKHFGFLNQPFAAEKNIMVLRDSVVALLDREDDVEAVRKQFGSKYLTTLLQKEMGEMWRKKLGLIEYDSDVKALVDSGLEMMEELEIDYTIFWWQLSLCTVFLGNAGSDDCSIDRKNNGRAATCVL